jgi:hypothetical protein
VVFEFLSFILMITFIASMSNYMLYFSCRRPGGYSSKHGPECLSLLTSVLEFNVKAGSEGKELFSEASAQCTYARLQLERAPTDNLCSLPLMVPSVYHRLT